LPNIDNALTCDIPVGSSPCGVAPRQGGLGQPKGMAATYVNLLY